MNRTHIIFIPPAFHCNNAWDIGLHCVADEAFLGTCRRVLLKKGSTSSSSWKKNCESKRLSWFCWRNSDRARFRKRALCRRWEFSFLSFVSKWSLTLTKVVCCFLDIWVCSYSPSSHQRKHHIKQRIPPGWYDFAFFCIKPGCWSTLIGKGCVVSLSH